MEVTKYQQKIEQAILELGTELLQLKSNLSEAQRENTRLREAFGELRKLLDEKNLVADEDFEIQLCEVMNESHEAESVVNAQFDLHKKFSH